MKLIKSNTMKKLLLGSTLLLFMQTSFANNLIISGTTVNGSNLSFNIKWDNSWYTAADSAPKNWDAVWIFIKYKNCDSVSWSHASLSNVSANHSTGNASLLKVDAVSDGKGVFIRRATQGTAGNIASTKVTLKLTSPSTTASFNFKVMGIEMVYVTRDSFKIGDNQSTYSFSSVTIDSAKQVNGIPKASTIIGGTNTTTDTIKSTYPMGFNAFYSMKYELTQKQYADFLNCLTYDQQANRSGILPSNVVGTVLGGRRMSIKIMTSGIIWNPGKKIPAIFGCNANGNSVANEDGDGNSIACVARSWADMTAYLDWTALRPMTELEFEKICRGTLNRVDYEYVWGLNWNLAGTETEANPNSGWTCNMNITNLNYSTEATKSVGNGLANVSSQNAINYGCHNPLRVGFAATKATNRSTAGAAYYGAMDMGGNLWEAVVSTSATGAKFVGNLGDGELDVNADANVTGWIDKNANGIGHRGGSYADSQTAYMRTSDRTAAFDNGASRADQYGIRGVR